MCGMFRVVALLLSALTAVGLFYAFGILALLLCFAAMIASVLFSSGPDEEQAQRVASSEGFSQYSTFMGGL
jgi:hypothetical protein